MTSAGDYLQFRSVLQHNRDVFLLNQRVLLECFLAVERNFLPIDRALSTARDADGHSHVSLIPFVHLFQRQITVAFDLMSSDLCYQGWVLVRPGLEAVLTIGKWLDDPELAALWSDKANRWKEYNKEYSGKRLQSRSLDESSRLQPVLSKINDEFVHANADYYSRHIRVIDAQSDDVNLVIDWFEDDNVQEAHAMSLIHLSLVSQETIGRALTARLNQSVEIGAPSDVFRQKMQARVSELAASDGCEWILRDLGLLLDNGDPSSA